MAITDRFQPATAHGMTPAATVEFIVVKPSAADTADPRILAAKLVDELGYAAALRLCRFNGWEDVMCHIRPLVQSAPH